MNIALSITCGLLGGVLSHYMWTQPVRAEGRASAPRTQSVLLADSTGNVAAAAPSQKQSDAIVSGTITDSTQAVIPFASVRISGNGRIYSMQVLSNGGYWFRLPPGTYEIRVTCTGCSGGLRGKFNLQAGTEVEFDFELVIAPFIDYVTSGEGSQLPPPARNDIYHSDHLKPGRTSGLQPLVLFGERREQDNVTTYAGPLVADRHLSVVYTYDLLTIKADTLTYSRKDNSVVATGHVVWRDGKDTKHLSSLRLTFRDGEPHVELVN